MPILLQFPRGVLSNESPKDFSKTIQGRQLHSYPLGHHGPDWCRMVLVIHLQPGMSMKNRVFVIATIEKISDMEPTGAPLDTKPVPFVMFQVTREVQKMLVNRKCKIKIEAMDER